MAEDEGNNDPNGRALIYRFEIQHIVPDEAFKDPARPALLKRAGITVDMRGNKVALLSKGDLKERRGLPEIA